MTDTGLYDNVTFLRTENPSFGKTENPISPAYENVCFSKIRKTSENGPNVLLQKTQEKVDELVEILHDNVGKAMERGEKVSDLNIISENLEKRASEFKTQAVVVKRKQWRQRMKTRLVFAGICAVFLIVIILIIVQYMI